MNSTHNHWLSRLASTVVLLVVTACAAPTVLNTLWTDPQFSAKPIRSILVVGVTNDTANRHAYEDAMVAQLTPGMYMGPPAATLITAALAGDSLI